MTKFLTGIVKFIWEFLIGDTPEIAAGVLGMVLLLLVIADKGVIIAWLFPVGVILLLLLSVQLGKSKV